jgi:hypothetical protein
MNALTCDQVQDEIELFAADECDAPTRAAIQQHLVGCPACAEALDETQQMLGLLTLRLREPASLARLRQRIGTEAKKQRQPTIIIFLGRAAAFAAALMLTVGTYFWLSPAQKFSADMTTVAMIQSVSPDAVYHVRGTHEVELEQGEVFVALRSDKTTKPFVIATPAGSAQTEGAECFMKVSNDGEAAVEVNVLRGKVALSNAKGSKMVHPGETARARRNSVPVRQIENLSLRFGRAYEPVKVQTGGKVPPYKLPVDLVKVKHYKTVAQQLPLENAESLLKIHGFAVLAGSDFTDLVSPYQLLHGGGLPIIVTADTLLHLYRLHLTATLRDIEEHEFADDLAQLTKALAAQVAGAEGADWQAARQLALTYLTVGLRLQRLDAQLADGVSANDVAVIVKAIESGGILKAVPGLGYGADFADFRPVGHYVHSRKLQGYFRAMMWFGRMPLLLRGGDGWIVSKDQAVQQTLAATLLANAVAQARLPEPNGRRTALEVWERIETVTGFYVGLSDDPGPQQYHAAFTKVGGKEFARPDNLHAFQRELLKHTALAPLDDVTRSPVATGSVNQLLAQLEPTAGFRLFGQRFAPDAHALSKLVYPNVGPAMHAGAFTATTLPSGKQVRGLPRGLDLMALLGSRLARQQLTQSGDDAYAGSFGSLSYELALEKLQREFARFDNVDWNANVYWSWLYTLQPLFSQHDVGYPTCMTTPAYNAHLLNTALASWTQLRNDTVLYSKNRDSVLESVKSKLMNEKMVPGPIRDKLTPVYLEPLPEVYGRLLALTRMSRKQLTSLKVLSAEGQKRLASLEELLERVVKIATKELANEKALDRNEEGFLLALPGMLGQLAASSDGAELENLHKQLTIAKLFGDKKQAEAVSRDIFIEECTQVATPVVTTIAVDVTGKVVLQEAIGRVDLAVFVLPRPDGSLTMAVGPVLSYYEMKRPRSAALTDGTWLHLLGQQPGPARPEWAAMYLVN